jgi:hypothetical protein
MDDLFETLLFALGLAAAILVSLFAYQIAMGVVAWVFR